MQPAAPLRLRDWQVAAVRAWTHLPGFLRHGRLAMMRKRKGSDVTDEKVRDENPALMEMPLAGIADVIELGEIVRRDLSFIHAPTLVGHGELDHTVPLRDSLELAGSLGADVVQRLLLPRSGHLIAVDVEHAKLCDAVVAFVTKYGRASSYARRYLS